MKLEITLISLICMIRTGSSLLSRCRASELIRKTVPFRLFSSENGDPPLEKKKRLRLPRLINKNNKKVETVDESPSYSRFTKVSFGSEDEIMRAEMDDRLKNAERWVSQKLTDEESDLLNKALGIDAEILGGMDGKTGNKKKRSNNSPEALDKGALMDDAIDTKKLRGFLELNPYICSGCGTNFQSKSEEKPGYLPAEKLQQHRANAEKIKEQQEAVKILQMAGLDIGSKAAEDVLLGANISSDIVRGVSSLSKKLSTSDDAQPYGAGVVVGTTAEDYLKDMPDIGTDYYENRKEHYAKLQMKNKEQGNKSQKDGSSSSLSSRAGESDAICICQRCFRLQQYGQVEEVLRPGWSENELLTPERFEFLLSSIKDNEAVVLCIVDVFDLKGSLLPNLRQIAGKNPIVIAANKVDLLPKDVSENRLTGWIHSEVKEFCGLVSPKDKAEKTTKEYFARGWNARLKETDYEGVLSRANVHLVSCQSGHGMEQLMRSLMTLADEHGNKVYVMGAANVGKSSFINRLLSTNYHNKKAGSRGAGKSLVPQATVSNLPGTTLDFLKIRLPNGVTMVDTPGLINRGQLTSRLTPPELKQVIPSKPVNAITLRVTEGKCVLIGGLAKIELLEAQPFFLTFFISNEIKLHPTDSNKADEFIDKHMGGLLFPPATADRRRELGPFETKFFEVEGVGWKESKYDIVIAGLGWIAVTGTGTAQLKVTVPQGTTVAIRPSLLPFEASYSTAKFTGGRIVKRSGKASQAGSYGWRA